MPAYLASALANDLFAARDELPAYERLNQYLIEQGLAMSKRQRTQAGMRARGSRRDPISGYDSFWWIDERVPQDDWRVADARDSGSWYYVGPYGHEWWVMKYSDPDKILPKANDLFSASTEAEIYQQLNQHLIAPTSVAKYNSFWWIDERVPQDDWRVAEARDSGSWYYVGPYGHKWWVMKYSDPDKILPKANDLFSASTEAEIYQQLNQHLIGRTASGRTANPKSR